MFTIRVSRWEEGKGRAGMLTSFPVVKAHLGRIGQDSIKLSSSGPHGSFQGHTTLSKQSVIHLTNCVIICVVQSISQAVLLVF